MWSLTSQKQQCLVQDVAQHVQGPISNVHCCSKRLFAGLCAVPADALLSQRSGLLEPGENGKSYIFLQT